MINGQTTVAEAVAKRLGADRIFSKHEIDFYSGGGLSIEKACESNEVDVAGLIDEIESVNTDLETREEVTQELLVKDIHEISPLAQKVAAVHGFGYPELIGVSDRVEQLIDGYVNDELNDEVVENHMEQIKKITNDFTLPSVVDQCFTFLYRKLENFETNWKIYKAQFT